MQKEKKASKIATTVRMEQDCADALDQFRREQPDLPTQPEAVRRILADWLAGNGYLASKEPEEDDAYDQLS